MIGDNEGWVFEGAPPRSEARYHFEVRIGGVVRQVQRVGSRAPLCLTFDYGALIYSDPAALCDESAIECWRPRTDLPVCQTGTWDPSTVGW